MITGQVPVPQRTPVFSFPTPRGQDDVLFYEQVDISLPKHKEWTLGQSHPDEIRYPHHKLVAVVPIDKEIKFARWFYCAARESQHLYNWDSSNDPDFPVLRQSFVLLRSEFDPSPADPETTYPPPATPFEVGDLAGYSITSLSQIRNPDPMLDNLFVVVNVVREKVSTVLTGVQLDEETGALFSYSRQKVPAGTAGSPPDPTGTYSEVAPINSLWSMKTTRKVAGLAGLAVGGSYTRPSYYIITPYSWPAVLNSWKPYSTFRPPLREGGYDRAITVVNYWRQEYNGPCVAEVIETWSQTPPAATILGAQMIATAVEWKGRLIDLSIPSCLHPSISVYETSGTDHPDYEYYYFPQQ